MVDYSVVLLAGSQVARLVAQMDARLVVSQVDVKADSKASMSVARMAASWVALLVVGKADWQVGSWAESMDSYQVDPLVAVMVGDQVVKKAESMVGLWDVQKAEKLAVQRAIYITVMYDEVQNF